MSKLAEIKETIEDLGFDIDGVHLTRDTMTISLIKTRFGDLGKRKTIYVSSSVSDKEYGEIFYYVCEKFGIPKKKS